jgi:hypothetical protein
VTEAGERGNKRFIVLPVEVGSRCACLEQNARRDYVVSLSAVREMSPQAPLARIEQLRPSRHEGFSRARPDLSPPNTRRRRTPGARDPTWMT